jgi:hypothetical protein
MAIPDARRRLSLAALSTLALPGCGTGIATWNEPGDEALRTRMEFVDTSLAPIPQDLLRRPLAERPRMRHVRAPDPIELLFAAVPGRVAGPGADLLLRQRLRREPGMMETESQRSFGINLGYMRRGLERYATAYQSRAEDQGMRVDPAPTRLARLALAPAEPGQVQPYPAITSFIDREGGLEHLLLFVDRPCRITGRIDLARTGTFTDADPELRRRFTGVFDHAIELPHAGLHWLVVTPAGERQWRVSRAPTPRSPVVFVLDSGVRLG